jgi:hypothetical protein
MQRDPLGYVDGMSMYAGYHVMRGKLDPLGLDIVIVFEPRKDDESSGIVDSDSKEMTNREFFQNVIVPPWNKSLEKASALASNPKFKDFEINGQPVSREEFKRRLSELKAVLHGQIPKDATPEVVVAELHKAAAAAGPNGEVLFESHGKEGLTQFGTLEEGKILIGGTYVSISKIGSIIGKFKGKLAFGACFLSKNEVQRIANDIEATVGGTSGGSHKIMEVSTTKDNKIIVRTAVGSQEHIAEPEEGGK